MHSIFVVSSITIYREGIVDFLSKQPELRVHGAAERLEQRDGDFDLCVLDPADQNDREIANFFEEMWALRTPIVVVAIPRDEYKVLTCLESGASGYVTRDQTLAELHEVIELTLETGACVHQRDLAIVLERIHDNRGVASGERDGFEAQRLTLTEREQQVARLLARSRSNGEIARDLGISIHTAKHHVRNTLAKLGVERRGDVVALRDTVAR